MTTLVFLPGLNNDARVWDAVIAALPSDLKCTAIDLPAIENLDELAVETVRGLAGGFVLVGHSFGGVVAMAILDAFPDRVQALVLVNVPQGTDPPETARQRLEKAHRAANGEFESLAMGRVDLVFYGARATDPEVIEERLRGVRSYGPQRYLAHSKAIAARPDRKQLLEMTLVPVLVVAAEHDVVVPCKDQESFAREIGADWTAIPQSAHMLPVEEPAKLALIISNWLQSRMPGTALSA